MTQPDRDQLAKDIHALRLRIEDHQATIAMLRGDIDDPAVSASAASARAKELEEAVEATRQLMATMIASVEG